MAFIIVADDDPIFSGILRMTLEDDGHIVGSLSDGRSAVQALKLKRPDLAILDVNMPGCSGVEVVRQLRECDDTRDIPVIMLTARNGPNDINIAAHAGADEYIAKPLDADLLLACVDRQLSRRRRWF